MKTELDLFSPSKRLQQTISSFGSVKSISTEDSRLKQNQATKFFSGIGKKCDYCHCIFFNSKDLNNHLKAFGERPHLEELKRLHRNIEGGTDEEHGNKLPAESWREGKYGGEICLANDPQVSSFLQLVQANNNKWSQSGQFEYKLSNNSKWLIRRRANQIQNPARPSAENWFCRSFKGEIE